MITNTRNVLLRVLVIPFACLFISSYQCLFAQSPQAKDLFTEVQLDSAQLTESQAEVLDALQQDKVTIDLRVVRVNFGSLINADSVNLNLSPDDSYMALREKIERRGDQDFTWYGSIPGKESNILLSVWEDAVVGFVTADSEAYNLQSLGDGFHAIVHVDLKEYEPCGIPTDIQALPFRQDFPQDAWYSPANDKETALPKSNAVNSSHDEISKLNQGYTIIKVFVAYTSAAKNGQGGTSGINALINAAIGAANDSYLNSGDIPIRLELAHKVEVSYTESDDGVQVDLEWCNQTAYRLIALNRFQNPSDGYMDEIHDLRGAYGGDVAVLLAGDAISDAGQAFDVGVAEAGGAADAFCIVKHSRAAAAGYWSFAHEIGHLQGARHTKGGKIYQDNCDLPFPYGHGYVLTGNNFQTIMGIEPGPTRIQYWSNPDVNYQGIPTGNATTADNARVLEETASTIADFVQEISGTINANKTLSGIVSITANVTVTNNATLTIT